MTDQNLDSPLAVESEAAAETLADPTSQRFLHPFLARDCTVSEAAEALGVSANSLLYRVNRLVEVGLLSVVREEPRAGRALKVYRSVADAFYVPFVLTKADTLETLLLQMDDYAQALFFKSAAKALTQTTAEVGFLVWRAESGEVRTRFAADGGVYDPVQPGHPLVLPFWSDEVYLDPEDARELLGKMVELIEQYHYRDGKQRYIMHLGLTPWVEP